MPYITHTLIWLTIYVALPNSKRFIRANCMPYIAHTLIWLPVSIVLPHRKQFEWINHVSCIPHTLLWLPVSVVLPHRRQFEWINCVSCITHGTKIWTVFDGSAIANVLHLFDVFLHHRLRLWHRTQFRRRVSDRSVVLAASYSSGNGYHFIPKGGTFPTETIMIVVRSSGLWEAYTQACPNSEKKITTACWCRSMIACQVSWISDEFWIY